MNSSTPSFPFFSVFHFIIRTSDPKNSGVDESLPFRLPSSSVFSSPAGVLWYIASRTTDASRKCLLPSCFPPCLRTAFHCISIRVTTSPYADLTGILTLRRIVLSSRRLRRAS